jgi:ArsR family transcriptional regulator, arsenate/arsenite/antimonite-responsive transcriptional repressor
MINKKESFGEAEVALADFAKAMSHPARWAIMRILADKQSCICGEIVDVLPLAQATVSQHLKALKEAGLIKGKIDGVKSCYCIDWQNFNALLAHFNTEINGIQNCC